MGKNMSWVTIDKNVPARRLLLIAYEWTPSTQTRGCYDRPKPSRRAASQCKPQSAKSAAKPLPRGAGRAGERNVARNRHCLACHPRRRLERRGDGAEEGLRRSQLAFLAIVGDGLKPSPILFPVEQRYSTAISVERDPFSSN